MTTRIFVYGTLMANERANHIITRFPARFINGGVVAGMAMHSIGNSYPAMISTSDGVRSRVFGEIWELGGDAHVVGAALSALDLYEGQPYLYSADAVRVRELNSNNGTVIDNYGCRTYLYNLQVPDGSRIDSGIWNEENNAHLTRTKELYLERVVADREALTRRVLEEAIEPRRANF